MKKNPTIVPVVDVIELGAATTLTMGMGIRGNEGTPNKPRPVYLQQENKMHIIELGVASTLTMGNGMKLFEGPDGRPVKK